MKKILLMAVLAACALPACGSSDKKAPTTPKATAGGAGGGSGQSMADTGNPDFNGGGSGAGTGSGGTSAFGGPDQQTGQEAPVVFPNLDPDPAQAKAQVDQHLQVARQALSAPTPDADTALREAKEALKIDATSIDAAAYYAFAYYHKK